MVWQQMTERLAIIGGRAAFLVKMDFLQRFISLKYGRKRMIRNLLQMIRVIRESLKIVLSAYPDIEVVGAEDGTEVLETYNEQT